MLLPTRGGSELLITYGEQHIHPICGDTCTHRRADGSYEHPNVTWTGTATLPDTAGCWYLTQNVEVGDTWTPAADTFLDLNGCSVAMTAEDKAVIAVSSGLRRSLHRRYRCRCWVLCCGRSCRLRQHRPCGSRRS